MVQPKAIFIGRSDPDSGLEEYKSLALRFNLKLDIYIGVPGAADYIPKYSYAFVSGYLSILEALKAGVPVFAYYHNQIKHDYHYMSPYSRFVKIFHTALDKNLNLKFSSNMISNGQLWANNQTWDKLASIYEKLWFPQN